MILESFSELEDKRPGPRGHKAGVAAQPALSSWLAFSPAAVTVCKTNPKILFRFSMDSLEGHDEHDRTSKIRHITAETLTTAVGVGGFALYKILIIR